MFRVLGDNNRFSIMHARKKHDSDEIRVQILTVTRHVQRITGTLFVINICVKNCFFHAIDFPQSLARVNKDFVGVVFEFGGIVVVVCGVDRGCDTECTRNVEEGFLF
jgi:hypothetical protein